MSGRRFSPLPILAVLLLGACGGGEGNAAPGGGGAPSGPWPPRPAGEVDEALAERGEHLFREVGCTSCHSVGGGRLVGPDLAGVTERRSYAWTMGMITSPDSMLREDSVARRMLGEYYTPMPDQGVDVEEARALWEHLREEDEEDDEDHEDEDERR